MKKKIYLAELRKLKNEMEGVANTPFSMFAKVVTLATMNMCYEKVAFAFRLEKHPFILAKEIIQDARTQFRALMDSAFIESDDKNIPGFKSLKKKKTPRIV